MVKFCEGCGNIATVECILCLKMVNRSHRSFCGESCYRRHFNEHRNIIKSKNICMHVESNDIVHPCSYNKNDEISNSINYQRKIEKPHSSSPCLSTAITTNTVSKPSSLSPLAPAFTYCPKPSPHTENKEYLSPLGTRKSYYSIEDENSFKELEEKEVEVEEVKGYIEKYNENLAHQRVTYQGGYIANYPRISREKVGYWVSAQPPPPPLMPPQQQQQQQRGILGGWLSTNPRDYRLFLTQRIMPFIHLLPNYICYVVYS